MASCPTSLGIQMVPHVSTATDIVWNLRTLGSSKFAFSNAVKKNLVDVTSSDTLKNRGTAREEVDSVLQKVYGLHILTETDCEVALDCTNPFRTLTVPQHRT